MPNPDAPRWSLCRRVALVLALILSAGSAALADELQDAAQLLKAGQHQQALERIDGVLAAKPNDPQARFMKGLIFTEQGKTRDAIGIFTKLTQDYPELPEPYNNLAVIYASQGQYERARAALEQSIRTHPSYATAYENLGDVYARLASQAYDKALQLDSSNAGAQDKLSLVRELVGGAARAPVALAQKSAPAARPAAQPSPAAPATAGAEKPPANTVEKSTPPPAAPAEILQAVDAWAKAWSNKDADAYLSFYARDFDTPRELSRGAWEKQRRERVTEPKFIAVSVASPKVTMVGSDEARVTFRQTYRSDRLRSASTKTLVMVRNDGAWKIRQERQGR
jgi:tetratricopeptide (TPR) repeat protein